MHLGTLGSVPRGGPFTLMETHSGKGGQRRGAREFLLCTDAGMTDSILAMGVHKVTLLLPSPQQVLEERWMFRTGDSNLLGTSSSLASVWLLQSTELLRVGLGPGNLNSGHSYTASILPTGPSPSLPSLLCVRTSASSFAN